MKTVPGNFVNMRNTFPPDRAAVLGERFETMFRDLLQARWPDATVTYGPKPDDPRLPTDFVSVPDDAELDDLQDVWFDALQLFYTTDDVL